MKNYFDYSKEGIILKMESPTTLEQHDSTKSLPTDIYFYPDGTTKVAKHLVKKTSLRPNERFTHSNITEHNLNGPSFLVWSTEGIKVAEGYSYYGKRCDFHGKPAITHWLDDGTLLYKKHAIDLRKA